MDTTNDEQEEEKSEGKEEKKMSDGDDGKEERRRGPQKPAKDKAHKFRLQPSSPHHWQLILKLLKPLLDAFEHMGVFLHGLHTCGAEQFARERYCMEFVLVFDPASSDMI